MNYVLEKICNVGRIKSWALKKYLFLTLVTLVFLYVVEEWGNNISLCTWKEFENVQKHFLIKFLQVKQQTPYVLLLLEIGSLPIEIMAMERVVEYMLKVKRVP